ncbi:MAG TPA: TIR domain-containing protein [Steroidobacteraceae bacterium]|nr:TIR domain-containing protein [Steroidobacteraceae bacterium]
MADIFVSYSRQDKALVAPLVAALEAEGWSVWWDPEITPGEEFDSLISRELERARALVVVWTPGSVDSRWVRGEARDAADRGVLVPVRFQNAKLPIDFRAVHTTDLDQWGEDRQGPAFRGLSKALEAKLGAPKKSATGASSKHKAPEVSICVLPFANMSGDPEQEYFSDGITEDVITDLGKVSALSIVSRNMAFSFKGAKGGVSEIGRQTKANYVLVGSVRKAGARVRITAQLVNAATEAQVWGERYDRDLNDIFALQDEISKAIVAALKLTLLPEEKRALEQRATTNVQAYKFYLMARQFSVMGNERHQEVIVRLCQRAVELDPSYAAPWATMAIAQWDMHRRSACEEDGREAANHAIRLDPKLADAHAALGAVHQGAGRYEEALKACEAALRLDPQSYEGNRVAGMCSLALHRFDDGVRYFEAAAASIEAEFMAASFAAQLYVAKGDYAGAREAAKHALARIEKVIAAEPDHGRALGYGAGLLAILGEAERAKEWIERGTLVDPNNTILHFNFVCALARLGERDAAVELSSRFIDKASPGMLMWFDNDTDLDPLRDHPRFMEIMRKAKARFAAT